MKFKILVISSFLIGSVYAEKSIEDQMSDINKPMKLLKRMNRAKITSGSQYNKAAKELLKAGYTFGKYQDKEDRFNKLNKDFQTALKKYNAALKAKSTSKIQLGFKLVSDSCTNCHDIYKQD